ncbi:hypothetical protein SAMN05444320_11395 [Streptoalloteichus hindustanus]|uniref:Histidine phosphatase superfamily (Branch 1) n=1 Tax=Streptoalloteichus hindustanus TaxID=2017 RepID=A0A1M5MFY6_STRHI|nr:hypothetical protein SAMN05444320_11395 [Streptoalloteichus hindustanus]
MVIIGHSETIHAALTYLIGTPVLRTLHLTVAPASVTTLRAVRERDSVPITWQRWELVALGDTTPLPQRCPTIGGEKTR